MNKLTLITLIILVALSITIIILFRQNKSLAEENKQKTNAITLLNQDVEVIKKENGQILYQNRTLSANKETMELLLFNDIKRLREDFGSLKNIKSYVKSGIESSGKFYTQIKDSTINDTIKISVANYSDKWLSQSCYLKNDSMVCEYFYRDSIEVVIFRTKNWKWYEFLKAKNMKKQGFDRYSHKTSVQFSNPNTKATNIKSIIKEE